MIASSFSYEVLQKYRRIKTVNNTVAVLAFLMSKKAQLPAIRITEQTIPLTKSKIKRTRYKFP